MQSQLGPSFFSLYANMASLLLTLAARNETEDMYEDAMVTVSHLPFQQTWMRQKETRIGDWDEWSMQWSDQANKVLDHI